MNNLRNNIKNLIEKKGKEIEEYNCRLEEIDKVLKDYKLSVLAGRKISLISGTLLTLFLNIVEAVFGLLGFALFSPSSIPVLLVNMMPLFIGIKYCIDTPKKIEREMNISVKELKDEKLFYSCLIKGNKEDINELDLKISDYDYNLKESCTDYGSIEDEIVYEEEKVLKLVKKN